MELCKGSGGEGVELLMKQSLQGESRAWAITPPDETASHDCARFALESHAASGRGDPHVGHRRSAANRGVVPVPCESGTTLRDKLLHGRKGYDFSPAIGITAFASRARALPAAVLLSALSGQERSTRLHRRLQVERQRQRAIVDATSQASEQSIIAREPTPSASDGGASDQAVELLDALVPCCWHEHGRG